MTKQTKRPLFFLLLLLTAVLLSAGCSGGNLSGNPAGAESGISRSETSEETPSDSSGYPAYSGQPYTAVNGNTPYFSEQDLTAESFEQYSPLDSLGRCGSAFACLGLDLMPQGSRGDISSIHPTGWHSVQYDCVDGKNLYNRCHLIGWQLSGEDANEKNLITGTRYMNVEGMLPFENMTADYIKETGCHVLYRVTPVFQGDNLLADGVLMEAMSVEDRGDSICFCVFVYNVQPGITIDYATGESALSGSASETPAPETSYILNTNTRRFHLPSCSSVSEIKDSNKETYTGSRDTLIEEGYVPCGICRP